MSSNLQPSRLVVGAGLQGPFASQWRGLVTLLSVLGIALTTFVELSVAGVPEPSKPTCVSCPAGYHCTHNPEGCEHD